MSSAAFLDRFWSKVVIGNDDECWNWNAYKDKNGYGYFHSASYKPPAKAHRLSVELATATEFPPDLFACHKCDNPSCVNPRHIYAGTSAENTRDMMARKRHNTFKKTHCVNGHERREDNGYVRANRRECLTCKRERAKAAYLKAKEHAA